MSRLTSFAPHQTHSLLWSPWGKWPTLHLVTIQKPEYPLSPPPLSISSHALSSFPSQHLLGCPSSPSPLPPPPPQASSLLRTGLLLSHFSPACQHLPREPSHFKICYGNLLPQIEGQTKSSDQGPLQSGDFSPSPTDRNAPACVPRALGPAAPALCPQATDRAPPALRSLSKLKWHFRGDRKAEKVWAGQRGKVAPGRGESIREGSRLEESLDVWSGWNRASWGVGGEGRQGVGLPQGQDGLETLATGASGQGGADSCRGLSLRSSPAEFSRAPVKCQGPEEAQRPRPQEIHSLGGGGRPTCRK